jgi:hypothetical protein
MNTRAKCIKGSFVVDHAQMTPSPTSSYLNHYSKVPNEKHSEN